MLALFTLLTPLFTFAGCGPVDHAAFAERPLNDAKCFVEGENLYLYGTLQSETVADVQRILRERSVRRLHLNSFGGNYNSGLALGKLVQENRLETAVNLGTTFCVSACTYVYQSGVKRFSHPEARFGYHGASLSGGLMARVLEQNCGRPPYQGQCEKDFEDLQAGALESAKTIFLALEKLGASPKLWEMYMAKPDDPEWFDKGEFTRKPVLVLRGGQLLGLGVVTDLVN